MFKSRKYLGFFNKMVWFDWIYIFYGCIQIMYFGKPTKLYCFVQYSENLFHSNKNDLFRWDLVRSNKYFSCLNQTLFEWSKYLGSFNIMVFGSIKYICYVCLRILDFVNPTKLYCWMQLLEKYLLVNPTKI